MLQNFLAFQCELTPRRRDLRDVGDGRGHHEGHCQSLECLEGENVSGVRDEGVAQHPGGVGQHADDDDVHVADDVSDGSGKDLKTQQWETFYLLIASFWLHKI